MFLFAWYHKLYSSIVSFLSKRKYSKKGEVIASQRKISLQKVKHLKNFTYWPIAKVKRPSQVNTQVSPQMDAQLNLYLTAKSNDLRYVKRVNKRLPKLPLFVKPINFNRQEIPSKTI